jgi:hypothetical protein
VVGIVIGATALAGVAGCGGDSRQDANERNGAYTVRIVKASFPAKQQLAQHSNLTIAVRNESGRTIPNVGVSIGKQGQQTFSYTSQEPGLADSQRPVWAVDNPPNGGTTAYVDTWTLGPLPPGQTKTFTWGVVAVKPGTYTIDYRVNAGLDGKTAARLAGGGQPAGRFRVFITPKPAQACVTDSGKVVREAESPVGRCPAGSKTKA